MKFPILFTSPELKKKRRSKRSNDYFLHLNSVTKLGPPPEEATTSCYKKYLEKLPKENNMKHFEELIETISRHKMAGKSKIHFLNTSTKETAMAYTQWSNSSKLPGFSFSTAPHYLSFSSNDIDEGNTFLKCQPLIREEESKLSLIQALLQNAFSLITSSHFPVAPEIKEDLKDFYRAMPGVNSLGFTLQAMWGVYKNNPELFEKAWKLPSRECENRYLVQLSELLCKAPAILMGINDFKGTISKGKQADFVVWDPDETLLCNDQVVHTSNKSSCIYHNLIIQGEIKYTFLRGIPVYYSGKVKSKEGKILLSASKKKSASEML